MSNYQPPVDELLKYGDCRNQTDWLNYVEELQLEAKHIPELIKMATDETLNYADPESQEVWSPLHAWRALGQLKASEALKPLLEMLDREPDDDWLREDLPTLCGHFGKESLPVLEKFLADASYDVHTRNLITEGLVIVVQQYPETRESVVATLVGELEKFRENDDGLNGFLVCALVDLQATEAIKTIRRAFQADRVDTRIMGDCEDVEVELGLKTRKAIKKQPISHLEDLTSLARKKPNINQSKDKKGFGQPQQNNSRKSQQQKKKK
ncbi:MAG: DUF1186 domain-containing protein [Halothece sp. Uz-M2-17]|nr:DUF1186 domain-containing protein [Halothece sp. Uz-M2-17]